MTQPARQTARHSGADEPLLPLSARARLPRRVRTALEGLLERTEAHFELALGSCLDEIDRELFRLAEHARSNEQQQHYFEGRREIRRGRADVAPRFIQYAESSLAHLGQTPKATTAPAVELRAPGSALELELVDQTELEEDLALQQVVSKAEIRHSQALYVLGHRFGVLAGSPALEADAVPLGPVQLGQALCHAMGGLDLSRELRVLAYQIYDRVAMATFGGFLDGLNTYLAQQHILPNLRPEAPRPRAPRQRREAGGTATSAAEATGFAPDGNGGPDTPDRAGRPPAFAGEVAEPRESQVFATLRELLAARRHALGIEAGAVPDGFIPSRANLQAVLDALQRRPSAPTMFNGQLVPRGFGQLKQHLLAQLREIDPNGRSPTLADEDSDTLDLVAMLFDFVGKTVRPESSAQTLMTKLQVPVLRVALNDKEFFTRREHPARQLLNTIVETGQHWLDDDAVDHSLVEKMNLVVDRISNDFDGDLGLFDNLLGDLSAHMNLLARRAEAAERRHVEAARGREKLDIAREKARAAIGHLLKRGKPTPLLRALIEKAWTDVLALTLLRQGADSTTYRRRLAVADQLLRRTSPSKLDATLRKEVADGLSQVGMNADDMAAIERQLFDAPRTEVPAGQQAAAQPSIALKLLSMPRLGGTASARPAAEAVPALNEAEKKAFENLRTLPFGTWFEFVVNQQGHAVRRKLAWFSTVSGHCLFVNQRGARAEEKTMQQLARDLVHGQVRLIETRSESAIDRAWDAIMTTLRQFTGIKSRPAAST
ncbi:MAG TPA: DUF1631 family protein [Rhodanobacteraceae bacterium]|nr:DUF1631 family protein [Rhodanobacteraceae bacterium]